MESIRKKMINLTPGDSIGFTTKEARLSYARTLASSLKRDYGVAFTVSVYRDSNYFTIKRIK